MTKSRFSRTHVCYWASCAVGLSTLFAVGDAAAAPVVVLTSYPEELTTAYEKVYEQAHPGTDVQILWQQGRDAMATLSKPDRGGVDVYWSPALFNFPALASRGVFQKLTVDRKDVPGRVGVQPISDPNGYFEAFEVAGYGIVTNPATLQFAGRLVMPISSRIGFSPQMYDIIVQAKGWEKGWALLSEMAGNTELTAKGGEIANAVADGKADAAIAIDFLIRNAISDGKPVSLVNPKGTAFLPAYVAIVKTAPHAEEARAFADFVLSNKGQSLLFAPGGARYPIRPDVYGAAPQGTINPFTLPEGSTVAYDLNLGPQRSPLISALFDTTLTSRAENLRTLWTAIHDAEAKANDGATRTKIEQARQLAGWVPVTDKQASDPAFLKQFEPQGRELTPVAKGMVASWSTQMDEKRAEASRLVSSTR